jgi:hypothetical protein
VQYDSITYVFRKDGANISKQEVIVGETNSNEAVITAGLQADEKVYLSVPTVMENDKISLLPELNGKRRKKEEKDVPTTEPVKVVSKVN